MHRRTMLKLSMVSLVSLGIAGCSSPSDTGETATDEQSKSSALAAAIEESFPPDIYGALAVDVYVNDDETEAYTVLLSEHTTSISKFEKDSDGNYNRDVLDSYEIPEDFSRSKELAEKLAYPSIKDYLKEACEPLFDSFANSLYDPDAAEYDDISIVYFNPHEFESVSGEEAGFWETTPILRLIVNGKNRFGAYAGRQTFYYRFDNGKPFDASSNDEYSPFNEMEDMFDGARKCFPYLFFRYEKNDFE